MIDNIFANVDWIAEAEYYIFRGITDREDVEDEIREYLREYSPAEEDIQEYTDKVFACI